MVADIVYYVRPGENEELRYSLRSLSNLEHGNVWIIGDKPEWVTNVRFIQGNRLNERWWNAFDNVRLLSQQAEASESLVVMNDDFFIMNPIEHVPAYWLKRFVGSDSRSRPDGPRIEGFKYASRLARANGAEDIKLYTSHTPMPLEKSKLSEVVGLVDEKAKWPPVWRSLYGNYWKIGGEQIEDVKILNIFDTWDGRDFLSTEDTAFTYGAVGRQIRSRFPNKSPYET